MHGTRVTAECSHFYLQKGAETIKGMAWKLKALLQWHTFSNKAPPPNPSQSLPAGYQAFQIKELLCDSFYSPSRDSVTPLETFPWYPSQLENITLSKYIAMATELLTLPRKWIQGGNGSGVPYLRFYLIVGQAHTVKEIGSNRLPRHPYNIVF